MNRRIITSNKDTWEEYVTGLVSLVQLSETLRVLLGHGADVKCVDWHPTKGLIVSGSKDSQQPVKLWDPKSGNSITTL